MLGPCATKQCYWIGVECYIICNTAIVLGGSDMFPVVRGSGNRWLPTVGEKFHLWSQIQAIAMFQREILKQMISCLCRWFLPSGAPSRHLTRLCAPPPAMMGTLPPLWGQLTSPGGKLFSATCQNGNLLQSSASEFSCPRGPSGGLVHLLRWELPPNLFHLPSEKRLWHQLMKIKRLSRWAQWQKP